MTFLKTIDAGDTRAIDRLLAERNCRADRGFERRVRGIVDRVRERGDRALVPFARRFEGVSGPLEVSLDEMRDEARRTDPGVRRAIRRAVSVSAASAWPE